jgi:phosphate transport system permease protein
MLNYKWGTNLIKILSYLSVIIVVFLVLSITSYIVFSGLLQFKVDFLFQSSGMIVTTLLVIGIALLIAIPLGIATAIFLQFYTKNGRIVQVMRFSIDSLNGIPSIIYGLFALSFFIYYLGFNRSIIAAGLTMSIVILPLIIKNTEEAIKTIDQNQINGSLALGVSKFKTINKVVLPYCIDGVINGVVLSVGRIIGETAAIIFVIGSASAIPQSIFQPGSTLATQLYLIIQEPTIVSGGTSVAYALALLLIIIVIVLNLLVKLISYLFKKKRG